jgi:hypothetical protein
MAGMPQMQEHFSAPARDGGTQQMQEQVAAG